MQKALSCRGIREENHKKIIRDILHNNEMLRSDLAIRNNISIMTVKNVVDELIAARVLEEKPFPTTVGRKPRMLHIANQYGVAACIGLNSRDYFSYRIFALNGEIKENRTVIFDEQLSYTENLDILCKQLQRDLEVQNVSCIGIGVSIPSAYYEEKDQANYDLIPEFKELRLRKYFSDCFQLKNISIVHDVFAAAQAEYDANSEEDLLYFYVGFGVGSAFIDKNGWHTGVKFMAGEVGHCLVSTDNGNEKLEDLVSIPSIMKAIHAIYPTVNQYQAFQLYDNGDTQVVSIIDAAVNRIAVELYNIAWILGPSSIIVHSNDKRLLDLIIKSCQPYIDHLQTLAISAYINIMPAKVNDAEMRGCFNITLEGWIDQLIRELPRSE